MLFFELCVAAAALTAAVGHTGVPVVPPRRGLFGTYAMDDGRGDLSNVPNSADLADPRVEAQIRRTIIDATGPTHVHFEPPSVNLFIARSSSGRRLSDGRHVSGTEIAAKAYADVVANLSSFAASHGKFFSIVHATASPVWTFPAFVRLAARPTSLQ